MGPDIDYKICPLRTKWQVEHPGVIEGTYNLDEFNQPTATIHSDLVLTEGPFTSVAITNSGLFPEGILHGITENNRGLTLVGVRETEIEERPFAPPYFPNGKRTSELTMWYAIEGACLSDEELQSKQFTVEISGQHLWAQWFSWNDRYSDKSTFPASFEYIPPKSLHANIPKGRIRLEDQSHARIGQDGSGAPHNIALRADCRFFFDFDEEIRVEDFLYSYLFPLQIFLNSATGSLSKYVVSLRLNFEGSWLPVKLSGNAVKNRQETKTKLLHTIHDFNFSQQMEKIFSSFSQNSIPFTLYSSLVDNYMHKHMPIIEFSLATQLIEAFYPNKKDAGSFRAKLTLLNEETCSPFKDIFDDKSWELIIGDLRNMLAHQGGAGHLSSLYKFTWANKALRIMIDIKLLTLYGFGMEDIHELVKESRRRDLNYIKGIYAVYKEVMYSDVHPSARKNFEKENK